MPISHSGNSTQQTFLAIGNVQDPAVPHPTVGKETLIF